MRRFSVALICLISFQLLGQGDRFQLDDGTTLHVVEAGEGKPMIFIPGWTMTHRFFEKQVEFFSRQYRVIAYDPRGQGRSDKTADGNTYARHADDLRQILMKKNLQDVVLVGWSSGCLAMYEYIRAFGYDRISSMVFIDEPPKWVGEVNSEWVYGSFENYRSSLKSLISKPSDPDGIIDWMLAQPVDSLTRQWMRSEILMTPRPIAVSLYIDGLICDYTEEVKSPENQIPTLFMVRSSWYERAKIWLKKHAPHSKVVKISSHAMFWEEPAEFNAIVRKFFESN